MASPSSRGTTPLPTRSRRRYRVLALPRSSRSRSASLARRNGEDHLLADERGITIGHAQMHRSYRAIAGACRKAPLLRLAQAEIVPIPRRPVDIGHDVLLLAKRNTLTRRTRLHVEAGDRLAIPSRPARSLDQEQFNRRIFEIGRESRESAGNRALTAIGKPVWTATAWRRAA